MQRFGWVRGEGMGRQGGRSRPPIARAVALPAGWRRSPPEQLIWPTQVRWRKEFEELYAQNMGIPCVWGSRAVPDEGLVRSVACIAPRQSK